MPQVRLSLGALRDLERIREFLRPKNPVAAKRAATAIIKTLQLLGQHPQAGRPDDDDPKLRELVIDFGDSGYVARYHYGGDTVTVIAVRHQKEAGY